MTESVVSIQACPGQRRAMQPLEDVELAPGGIEDDRHFAPASSKQLLLVDAEALVALSLAPGEIKENLTVAGVNVMAVADGTRLSLGEAVVEITKTCDPCYRMDEIRSGLKDELVGRRGKYARVVRPGRVRRGDLVQAVSPLQSTLT